MALRGFDAEIEQREHQLAALRRVRDMPAEACVRRSTGGNSVTQRSSSSRQVCRLGHQRSARRPFDCCRHAGHASPRVTGGVTFVIASVDRVVTLRWLQWQIVRKGLVLEIPSA
jgi:hypothetical protein